MSIKQRIDSALEAAVAACEARGAPPRLAAAMRHAVFPGGARMRPQLCLAVAAACGDDAPALADGAAAAIELMHCASLVHDDLPCFDDALQRRGLPSVHAVRRAHRGAGGRRAHRARLRRAGRRRRGVGCARAPLPSLMRVLAARVGGAVRHRRRAGLGVRRLGGAARLPAREDRRALCGRHGDGGAGRRRPAAKLARLRRVPRRGLPGGRRHPRRCRGRAVAGQTRGSRPHARPPECRGRMGWPRRWRTSSRSCSVRRRRSRTGRVRGGCSNCCMPRPSGCCRPHSSAAASHPRRAARPEVPAGRCASCEPFSPSTRSGTMTAAAWAAKPLRERWLQRRDRWIADPRLPRPREPLAGHAGHGTPPGRRALRPDGGVRLLAGAVRLREAGPVRPPGRRPDGRAGAGCRRGPARRGNGAPARRSRGARTGAARRGRGAVGRFGRPRVAATRLGNIAPRRAALCARAPGRRDGGQSGARGPGAASRRALRRPRGPARAAGRRPRRRAAWPATGRTPPHRRPAPCRRPTWRPTRR